MKKIPSKLVYDFVLLNFERYGTVVYSYGAIVPNWVGNSFNFDFATIHAYDDRRRRGSGPWFHAMSRGIPLKNRALTNDGYFVWVSGCFPELAKELVSGSRSVNIYMLCGSYAVRVTHSANAPWGSSWGLWLQVVADAYQTPTLGTWTFKSSYWVQQRHYDGGFSFSFPEFVPGVTLPGAVVLYMLARMQRYVPLTYTRTVKTMLVNTAVLKISQAYAYFNYKYNELTAYQGYTAMAGILGARDFLPNLYLSGFSTAYFNAVDDMPSSSLNGVENAFGVIDLISDLRHPLRMLCDVFKSAKDVRNIWLSYRYVIKTTELDIDDVKLLAQRLNDLRSSLSPIKIRGTYRKEDMLFRCKASFHYSDEFIRHLESIPYRMGMELTAAKLWDIIPYSFIADWFIGVADLLDYLETMGDAFEISASVRDIWYSVETSYNDQTVYFRIAGDDGHPLISSPKLVTKDASTKTVLMRVTDTLAIFCRR